MEVLEIISRILSPERMASRSAIQFFGSWGGISMSAGEITKLSELLSQYGFLLFAMLVVVVVFIISLFWIFIWFLMNRRKEVNRHEINMVKLEAGIAPNEPVIQVLPPGKISEFAHIINRSLIAMTIAMVLTILLGGVLFAAASDDEAGPAGFCFLLIVVLWTVLPIYVLTTTDKLKEATEVSEPKENLPQKPIEE